MVAVRRVVIDVLKPHEPPLAEFTERVAQLDTAEAVTTSLIELDREVQNVKATVEGEDVDIDALEAAVENLGGTVHSVDQVACGEYVAEDRPTLQDG
mgnify:CR=1 FL=1